MVRASVRTLKNLKVMSDEMGVPMSQCVALLVRDWLKINMPEVSR